jgi:hypothetical protein
MTRHAPQPACARARQLVAVWLGCVLWWSAGANAHAQSWAELERALTVTRELPGCVSAAALRARTAQYLGRAEQLARLTIEVDLQVPQFRVLRDGTLLAERRFARPPTDCSERRDALALAVAIAIEQVALAAESGGPVAAASGQPVAADSGSTTQPSAAASRVPVGGSGSPRQQQPSADERSAAARNVEQPLPETEAPAPSDADVRAQNERSDARTPRSGVVGSTDTAASTEQRATSNRTAQASGALRVPAQDSDNAGEHLASAPGAVEPAAPPLTAADGGASAQELTKSGRPRAMVSVLAGGALMFEALPTAAPGLSLGAELALLPALRIGLSGLFSTPVTSSFQGGTVSTQLYGAQLTGCINAPIFASLLVHGCAGAVGGVVDAHGDRFAQNLSDRMGWLAGLVRARLEFPAAGRLAAGVYADARVNFLRPELQASLATLPVRSRAVGVLGAALGFELIVRLH